MTAAASTMVAASSSSERELPSSSAQLVAFLESLDHDENTIRRTLIPTLDKLALSTKGEKTLATLDRVGGSNDPLSKYMVEGLTKEDLESETVELVYMLSARLGCTPSDKTHTVGAMTLARSLTALGSSQLLSLVLPRLSYLAAGIVDLAVHIGQPALALKPLEDLMASLPPFSLSGVHSAYLETCLMTRIYQPALQIISNPVLEVHQTLPSYTDVLTFYHHAGLICAALKDWQKAREMFEVCLILPGHAVSAIQLVAGKRAILCELLWSGKSYSLPRQSSSSLSRAFDKQGGVYPRLSNAFGAARWSEVDKIIRDEEAKVNDSIFVNDDNVGLINQVAAAIPKRKIWKLTQTYSKMSLDDLAVQIGLKGKQVEVEAMLTDMINDQRAPLRAQLSNHASPSGPLPIVTFAIAASPEHTASQARAIESLSQTSTWWERVLSDRSRALGLDHKWLIKQAARIESSQAPPEIATVIEEDLMKTSKPGRGVRGAGADWNDTGF